MFQRHHTEVLFGIYSLASLALLSWSADRFVHSLKHAFFYLVDPAGAPLVQPMAHWGRFGSNVARLIQADRIARRAEARGLVQKLDEDRLAAVEEENRRLSALLGLPRWSRFDPHPARVWARNATDWFRSVLVQGSEGAPFRVGDAAVMAGDGRVLVLGQVTEVLPGGKAHVLLLTDPTSSLSARVVRTGEQGLVEGRGANVLLLNYLFSDSGVQPGDEVVTAGLGGVFPEGLLVGRVLSVQEASHESFKRAVIAPAARLSNIRELQILSRPNEAEEKP